MKMTMKNRLTQIWSRLYEGSVKALAIILKLRDQFLFGKGERISATQHYETRPWVRYSYSGTAFMLIEDLHLMLLPSRRISGKEKSWNVTLEPDNKDVEGMLVKGIGSRSKHWDLAEAIDDFVESAASQIVHYGRATFEIVFEKDSSGNLVGFQLEDVNPLTLKKVFGSFYQLVPRNKKPYAYQPSKPGIRRIPGQKMVCIDMPKKLGGRSGYRKMLQKIVRFGEELIPKWQMDAMRDNRDLGFNSQAYQDLRYQNIGRITAGMGWHQRDHNLNTETTEYHGIYRHLQFEKSRYLLRNHILSSLEDALNGKIIDANVRFKIIGLRTVEEIDESLGALKKGDVNFSEIVTKFLAS
jgi:hypothetical protein